MKKIWSCISGMVNVRFVWVMADQVVFSLNSFLTTIMLAAKLGLDDFGLYSAGMLMLYFLLAVNTALIISPWQVLYTRQEKKIEYLSSLYILQCLFALFVAITVAIVLIFLDLCQWPILAPLSIMIFLFLLYDCTRRLLLTIGKEKHVLWTDVINAAGQLGGIISLGSLFSISLVHACWILSVTYIPAILFGMTALSLKAVGKSDIMDTYHLHRRESGWLLLTAGLQWWSSNFLVAVSGWYLGVRALGALRLSQAIFGLLNVFLQVFDNYVTPLASGRYEQSPEKMRSFLNGITRNSLLVFIPVLLLIMLFSEQVIQWAGGSEYTGYGYTLQWLSVLYLFIFIGYPVRICIRVLLLNRAYFTAYLFSFAFTLAVAGLVAQQWGLKGILMAFIMNQLIMLAYWHWVLQKNNFILWR